MSELAQRLAWAEAGSRRLLDQLDLVPDKAFAAECSLPGWTTAHLAAHVSYNAQALSRLVHWARTGEETPMYASAEARNTEIEKGTTLSPAELRTMARETDERLRAEFAELPEAAWKTEVRTAQGDTVSATEIPWMRAREVWIHAVDLGTGLEFADFPAEFLDALITDITASREREGRGPALLIQAKDRNGSWRVDLPGEEARTVQGTAAELARWLAGRGPLDGPDLGRWL
jgi:maleylpyruvate isomerase